MRYVFYYAADLSRPRGSGPALLSRTFKSRIALIAWTLVNRKARAALFAGRWRILFVQEAGYGNGQ